MITIGASGSLKTTQAMLCGMAISTAHAVLEIGCPSRIASVKAATEPAGLIKIVLVAAEQAPPSESHPRRFQDV